MSFIIGVRFAEVGKIYYFDPGELELEMNDKVVVETSRRRGVRRGRSGAAGGGGRRDHEAAEEGAA